MADITVDEIRREVEQALPVGAGGVQFTHDNIYKFQRSHSTDGYSGDELNAVTVEFQAKEKQEFDGSVDDLDEERINAAITNQYQPEHKEVIQQLENAMQEIADRLGYRVVARDKVNGQWGRLMYEFRAPTTGEAKWLKDDS